MESLWLVYRKGSGGMGGDDNYKITILEPLLLKGTITDSINGQPIGSATFRLLNDNNEQIAFIHPAVPVATQPCNVVKFPLVHLSVFSQ